jgi:hypothetical protein
VAPAASKINREVRFSILLYIYYTAVCYPSSEILNENGIEYLYALKDKRADVFSNITKKYLVHGVAQSSSLLLYNKDKGNQERYTSMSTSPCSFNGSD